MHWINIKEQKPEKNNDYLTYTKNGSVLICKYDINQKAFYLHGSYSVHIDFWAEIILPEEI